MEKVKRKEAREPKATKERDPEKEKASGSGKGEKLMGKVDVTMTALQSITPLSLWQGSVKMKDVEARLQKAMDVSQKLEADPSSENKELGAKILEMAGATELLIEIVTTLRDAEKLHVFLPRLDETFVERLSFLPGDCVNAILSDMGRKILQERDVMFAKVQVADLTLFVPSTFTVEFEWPGGGSQPWQFEGAQRPLLRLHHAGRHWTHGAHPLRHAYTA